MNYANLTSERREGPSKLLSTYLIKSRLSPMILPLCSNAVPVNFKILLVNQENETAQSIMQ